MFSHFHYQIFSQNLSFLGFQFKDIKNLQDLPIKEDVSKLAKELHKYQEELENKSELESEINDKQEEIENGKADKSLPTAKSRINVHLPTQN